MTSILNITIIVTLILVVPVLFRQLRLPSIVGLILAGILIGPYGFQIVERDSVIDFLSKIGLYYIMFTSGIEIDINDFKRERRNTIFFGSLTFAVPLVLGFFVSVYVLRFSVLSSLLLAAMFASHTLMAYPVVSRYGIQKNSAVGVTIGGTMIAVTLSLLLIAGVSSFSKGELTIAYLTHLIVFSAIFIVVVLWIIPKIAHFVFRQFNDSILQFTFVLLAIFVGVLLSELAGLEGILGAFLVGLALNRLIPNLSPLMNRISFVGNAIFIPVFLISIGMLVDPSVFLDGVETWFVAVVMCLTALATKWIAAWLTQLRCIYSTNQRQLIFGLSGAKAAVSLASVMIGYNLNLFSADVLNGTVVMILVTCTVSSIVTEKSARHIAQQQNPENRNTLSSTHSILLPLANPDNMEALLNLAFICADPKQGMGITALRVVKNSNLLPSAEEQLVQATQLAQSAERQMSCYTQVAANVANGIADMSNRLDSGEIIIGSNKTEVQLEDINMLKDGMRTITYGNVITHLLNNQSKQITIYKPKQPINTITTMRVAIPAGSEREAGFYAIYDRIYQMSAQLGCSTIFYAQKQTTDLLQTLGSRPKKEFHAEYNNLEDWEDFLLIAKDIKHDDMLVVVQARKGTISYNPLFSKMPYMLYRFFKDNSWVVIYPEQQGTGQQQSKLI